jgi:hypothetical protein
LTPASPASAPPTAQSSASAGPSTGPSSGPTAAGSLPAIGSCRVFPADNAWNADISNYPVDPNSAGYMAEMNPHGTTNLHPDFGSNPSYGIPINVDTIAPAAFTPITFNQYPSESDPGPYPIPSSPAIEAGSDTHMLIVDQSNCKLYETFATSYSSSTDGLLQTARSSTSRRTHSGLRAGPRPTRPVFPSQPAWSGSTKCKPGRSTTPSASR